MIVLVKNQTAVAWDVEFHDEFVAEYRSMDPEQRKALLAAVTALKMKGPTADRPLVGTLKNAKHPNMKELRYDAHGSQVWRAAFAFDPARKAIVLVAGEKQGTDERQFYKDLLKKANKRFGDHLKALAKALRESPVRDGKKRTRQGNSKGSK